MATYETKHGLRIARPEMMALANLLHHPRIAPDVIAGTTTKRSNKDLGRVLALAWLAGEQDRRNGTNQFELWAEGMAVALRNLFPDRAQQLAVSAGTGIRELPVFPLLGVLRARLFDAITRSETAASQARNGCVCGRKPT